MYAGIMNAAGKDGFAGHVNSMANVGDAFIVAKKHQYARPYGPSVAYWPGDTFGRRQSKRTASSTTC